MELGAEIECVSVYLVSCCEIRYLVAIPERRFDAGGLPVDDGCDCGEGSSSETKIFLL